ncbi:23S rRNA (guanine(745)-N(1))-methyltransferase [Paenibacillus allorhizosphaerae]|uniref:23S rRNA (Guanine(745)-N(1))-methyltransferase n=2 Tax=Paenibacillus allorhizosphaerae TaxID=2849866 RepID=A0ABM8VME4_9BACL|nr:23S rRNA (guanine(745)-N(1))-methyltransferase [Paenibacillus allorhizosphaerae]
MAAFSSLFRCPICFLPMHVIERKSLVCAGGHSFDLSRYGYVNFLSRPVKAKYDKQLFASRKILSDNGFFKPLDTYISEQIIQSLQPGIAPVQMIDAGCGEGSRLSSIKALVNSQTTRDITAIGLDIAKEAVAMAARHDPQSIWCVGDLARCPLASEQFQFIINILSPSNYSEFQRMLAQGGIMVKVVPGSHYLRELRELVYGLSPRPYSNSDTQQLFEKHFHLLHKEQLQYAVRLKRSLITHLVRMTPLSWGATDGALQHVLALDFIDLTIDLTILIGQKSNCLKMS